MTSLRLLAALGLLVVLGWAAWGIPKLQRHPGASGRVRLITAILALLLGIGLCFVRYMPRPDVAIWGLPLPFLIFQRHDGRSFDYVGTPVTMAIGAVVNVVFTSGLVHWLTYFLTKRHKPRVGAAA